ncbi:MAG: pitrilysin family protein [Gemmatimonadetes bacterium]|nr:pitrilysin family protein [Gemmatimonadota bacterium]
MTTSRSTTAGTVATLLAASASPAALAQPPLGASAPGESLPVVRHELANGMTFLTLPRRQAPIVAVVVRFPVGSVDEHLGNTGIAHVLEHMLFKGSREIGTVDFRAEAPLLAAADRMRDSLLWELALPRPDTLRVERLASAVDLLEDSAWAFAVPNEYSRILSAAGARGFNATTSHEATTYYVELPSNRLELWFLLESDRMKDPVLRGLGAELGVVREERRLRLETSPGGVLEAALMATAFHAHPYGVPIIGHASDVERLTRRQLADYFRDYYGAAGAVVALVGDVDPEAVARLAEEHFASVPRGRPPRPVPAHEPRQRGERRITVEFDAEPRLTIAWRAVAGHHEDAPALAMLASVLTAGRSTRLYRRLIAEDRSAIFVSASLGPGFAYPGLFRVSAVPRSPHSPEELERTIYEEIARLQEEAPDVATLVRIGNQIRAAEYRRLSSNLELAMQIADSEGSLGDWRETFRLSRHLLDVTPEDVRRVARKYLVPAGRTVATMVREAP